MSKISKNKHISAGAMNREINIVHVQAEKAEDICSVVNKNA